MWGIQTLSQTRVMKYENVKTKSEVFVVKKWWNVLQDDCFDPFKPDILAVVLATGFLWGYILSLLNLEQASAYFCKKNTIN